MAASEVRLEGHSQFDFDLDSVKIVLRGEGREVAKIARRLISRRAISKSGEFPGQQTGFMKKTLRSKVSRPGLAVSITHQLKSGQDRYPFILAYGAKSTKLSPRQDHIAEAMIQRRSQARQALRGALRKTIKPKGKAAL